MKKIVIFLMLVGVGLSAMVVASGCRRGKANAVSVMGSTSIQPFAEMLAQDFDAANPTLKVEVQGGGSAQGLKVVAEDTAEIGMCSRELKKEESGYVRIQIAVDGLAIVVHPSNPINNLTREQIAAIFGGKDKAGKAVTNWNYFSTPGRPMPDAAIHIITREEGSGTREAFQKLVMKEVRISRKAVTQESNGAVKELVRADRAGIGYMSLGLVGSELKIIGVDGVLPTHATVTDKSYGLVRPFLFVTKKGKPISAASQSFIDYVLSDSGQKLLEKEGLVRAPREGKIEK